MLFETTHKIVIKIKNRFIERQLTFCKASKNINIFNKRLML